jgi:hypothetical protein
MAVTFLMLFFHIIYYARHLSEPDFDASGVRLKLLAARKPRGVPGVRL